MEERDMGHAYFCAKCDKVVSSSRDARRLATKLGVTLWLPIDKVEATFPEGAIACKLAIDTAEMLICQPPIGNDCSWELGYAAGLGKPIYVLGSLPADDWMTKIDARFVAPDTLLDSRVDGSE
jgi:hypothetical protein